MNKGPQAGLDRIQPSNAPIVNLLPPKGWGRGTGLPHLQDGRALLIFMHLGGQSVELEGHTAQVGEELAVVRLLSTHAQGGLQALQMEHEIAVFWRWGPQLLWEQGDDLYQANSPTASPFLMTQFPLWPLLSPGKFSSCTGSLSGADSQGRTQNFQATYWPNSTRAIFLLRFESY